MRIACLGGGPAGLHSAILMKLRASTHGIDPSERIRPGDTLHVPRPELCCMSQLTLNLGAELKS